MISEDLRTEGFIIIIHQGGSNSVYRFGVYFGSYYTVEQAEASAKRYLETIEEYYESMRRRGLFYDDYPTEG